MSVRVVISEYLPPHVRDALIRAAHVGNHEEIDRITDLVAMSYPDLVLRRTVCRDRFVPVRHSVTVHARLEG